MTEIDSCATQRARGLPPRDARGRFVARPGATPMPARVLPPRSRDAPGRARSLPSRDARGRFVDSDMTNDRTSNRWILACQVGNHLGRRILAIFLR